MKRYRSKRRLQWVPSLSTCVLFTVLGYSAVQYLETRQVTWLTDLFRHLELQGKRWFFEAESLAGRYTDSAIAVATADTQSSSDLEGSVVKVKDGDSLILKRGTREYEIRLYGIDAPEWKQPHGELARAALKRLVLHRRVRLQYIDTDTYGRLVGRLFQGQTDINLEMVRSGNAWWYQRYAPADKALQQAESRARADHLGLWRDPAPLPPWQWRRGNLTQKR